MLIDDLLSKQVINRKANKIREFFPKIARKHGGTGMFCNAPNCIVNGGRNEHFQDKFGTAKAFVLSSLGISSAEE